MVHHRHEPATVLVFQLVPFNPMNSISRAMMVGVVAGACSLASLSHAQIAINAAGTYSQTFDSLPGSGSNQPWTNNVTLAGWYAQRQTGVLDITASAGSSSTADLYSFGSSGSGDRALGSVGGTASGSIAWGLIIQNTSADMLTFTNFSYVGELWRRDTPVEAEKIDFDYKISSVASTDLLAAAGWTAINALDFTNPSASMPTGGVNGNLAANRVALASVLNLDLAPGQYITFRWLDIDHGGNDNGLGVDDLSIAYVTAPVAAAAVPEPATYGMFGVAGLVGLVAMSRRRRLRRT
jgi:hypothetical protein